MKRLILLAILLLPGIALAQPYDYHRTTATGSTANFCGPYDSGTDINQFWNGSAWVRFEDASAVMFYEPEGHWVMADQTAIGIWDSCTNDPIVALNWSSCFGNDQTEGLHAIAPAGQANDNLVLVQNEDAYGVCLIDMDELYDGTPSVVTIGQWNWPTSDPDCTGRPDSGGNEGVAFIPDAGCSNCRYGGYIVSADQTGRDVFFFRIDDTTGNIDCVKSFGMPTCDGSGTFDSWKYDFDNDVLYVSSSNGECTVTAPVASLLTGTDYAWDSQWTNPTAIVWGPEGYGFGGGNIAYTLDVSDTSGHGQYTLYDYNGLWLFEDYYCGDDNASTAETCDGTDLDSKDCTDCPTSNAVAADCTAENVPYDCCLATPGTWSCSANPTCAALGVTGSSLACESDCLEFDVGACTPYASGQTCLNDIREGTEVCDGTDLDGKDCSDCGEGNCAADMMGAPWKDISCAGDCLSFVTTECKAKAAVVTGPTNLATVSTVDPSPAGGGIDPASEISGVAISTDNNNIIWANDDNGGEAHVYAISRTTGAIPAAFDFNAPVALPTAGGDIEDIAVGPGPEAGKQYVYLADTGSNASGRDNCPPCLAYNIWRVKEEVLTDAYFSDQGTVLDENEADNVAGEIGVGGTDVQQLTFQMPEDLVAGTYNQDIEAMFIDPLSDGDIYFVTKRTLPPKLIRIAVADQVWGRPPASTVTAITDVGDLPWTLNPGAVGADMSNDGRLLGIVTESQRGSPADGGHRGWFFQRDPYTESVADALSNQVYGATVYRFLTSGSTLREAISFDNDNVGGFVTINEGAGATIRDYSVTDQCDGTQIDPSSFEVCDGANISGLDCTDFGYPGGTLGCLSDCTDYDFSACTPLSPTSGTVTIDYSVDQGTFLAKGTGHTGQMDSSPLRPSDDLYENVHEPYSWRGGSIDVANNSRYLATADVFSFTRPCSTFSAAYSGGDDCSDMNAAEPWGTDSADWIAVCDFWADSTITDGTHDDIIWDIWNEANSAGGFYDNGDPSTGVFLGQRWADTYEICYEALSAEYTSRLGNDDLLVAGGPAFSAGMLRLFGFLFESGGPGYDVIEASDYYLKNNVEYQVGFGWMQDLEADFATVKVDFLSIHLFGDEVVMDWGEHVDLLRTAIIAEMGEGETWELTNLISHWGSNLENLDIHITEMFGVTGTPYVDFYSDGVYPGHVVVALGEMHETDVQSMTRACNFDPEGVDNDGDAGCGQKALSGLLRPDLTTTPTDPDETRAAWWVYDYYGRIEGGQEAPVSSDYARVHGVAADNGTVYSALIGFTHMDRNGDATLSSASFTTLDVVMQGLGADCSTASATVKHISPANYLAQFDESDLTVNSTEDVTISGGETTIQVTGFDANDAVYITVDTAPCAAAGGRRRVVVISGMIPMIP